MADTKTIELTAEITAAYVSNNAVAADTLAGLIASIFAALTQTETPLAPPVEAQPPAVPIRRSVQPDFIVCLEDGKPFKSLKRHLESKYGLTPAAYRTKWGLSLDYPMVAPNYATARSALAKASGLGAGGRRAAPTAPSTPAPTPAVPAAESATRAAKAPKTPKPSAKAGPGATVPKAKRNPKAIDPATDDFT